MAWVLRVKREKGSSSGIHFVSSHLPSWGQEQALWKKEGDSRTQNPEALSRTMEVARGGMRMENGYGRGLVGKGRPVRAVSIPKETPG